MTESQFDGFPMGPIVAWPQGLKSGYLTMAWNFSMLMYLWRVLLALFLDEAWALSDLFGTGTSGCPTNRGSRNLTNGHQVLQLDNGLELFNLLSLYPAEGFCGPLCFDFSGSDFGSTFSHLITIWWISLDLTGITTLIPWKWIFDLVRQTYTCV